MFIENGAGTLCICSNPPDLHSFPVPIFNKQLIDLVILEVFLYLDDTIDNNDDNVQSVEKDSEVCMDLFRLRLVFFIF